MRTRRKSGILLPVFSLPSEDSIGCFDESAYRWIDFLVRANQSYWQILPLNPSAEGNSPYSAKSSFAISVLYADLNKYTDKKTQKPSHSIDYDGLEEKKRSVVKRAFEKIHRTKEMLEFYKREEYWLEDYSLFCAIEEVEKQSDWRKWKDGLRNREEKTIQSFKRKYAYQIDYYKWEQYLLHSQWYAIKKYAHQKGIQIIGDLPIYVSRFSVDVWAHKEVFEVDKKGHPLVFGGVPPDGFSQFGQHWNMPVFDWKYLKENNYRWWIERLKKNENFFDLLRLDHFRGFVSYWEIPRGEEARNGSWKEGPGLDFFDQVKKEIPHMNLIAEDLGMIDQSVRDLLKKLDLPGMSVLQFAFDTEDSLYLPHNVKPNSVVYTGTHDNNTIIGWINESSEQEFKRAKEYMRLTREEGYVEGVIKTALACAADICILQMQDLLNLDARARMNRPGISEGNWKWRLDKSEMEILLAQKLHGWTKTYGRDRS